MTMLLLGVAEEESNGGAAETSPPHSKTKALTNLHMDIPPDPHLSIWEERIHALPHDFQPRTRDPDGVIRPQTMLLIRPCNMRRIDGEAILKDDCRSEERRVGKEGRCRVGRWH